MSRREEFGLGTIGRQGAEGPLVSAIDRVGGDSSDFIPRKGYFEPQGFTNYDDDSDNWSNYDRNRYGTD